MTAAACDHKCHEYNVYKKTSHLFHVSALRTGTPACPSLFALHTPPFSNHSSFQTSTFALTSSRHSSPALQLACL